MYTTDHDLTVLEQPSENAQAEHPSQPVDAPPPTNQRRTALRWFGGGIAAVAAAGVVSVLAIAADASTSENHVVPEFSDDNVITELDVHGIPTRWSRQGGAPRHDNATELDVHGIPTWWSESARPGDQDRT